MKHRVIEFLLGMLWTGTLSTAIWVTARAVFKF
jgi:hypothetical protein